MPPVIIAAVAYLYAMITVVQLVLVVVAYAYSQYSASRARKKQKDAFNASLQDRLTMVSTASGMRSRVYGRVRNVDGILFKGTRGTNSEFFTLVIAVAGHEVDAIETVFFNDVPVTLSSDGYVTTAPWAGAAQATGMRRVQASASMTLTHGVGSVTLPYAPINDGHSVSIFYGQVAVPSFSISGNTVSVTDFIDVSGTATITYQFNAASGVGNSKARVQKYLGSPTQDLSTVLAPLFPGVILPGVHRFSGIACLVVDLQYDQDAFPSGVPNISAITRGAKVYDPRNGTTAWSENPALIARDWSLYAQGGNCQASELRDDSFIAAANACDVSHSFVSRNAAGTSVTTVRKMFTCGIVCPGEADPSDTLSNIVESMAGAWAWTGGQLRVRAGAYTPPVATLTESWCSGQGDIEIVAGVARTELVNVYTPTIADKAQNFIPVPIPRIAATEYITLDGGELPRDVTLEGVTDSDHAQHVCGIFLRDQRQGLTASIPCKMVAYPIEVFDCIAVNLPRFGFVNKEFLVMGWQFSQTGGVVLSLKETGASIFDPDAQFTRSDPIPNSLLPSPFLVPSVVLSTPLSGTAQLLKQADGTIVSRILVKWSNITDEAVVNHGTVEVRYGLATADPSLWQSVIVEGRDTQVFLTDVQDGAIYMIMARAKNTLVRGDWCPAVAHLVVGKTALPTTISTFTLSVVPGALKGTRTPSPDIDYDHSIYRVGSTFAGGTDVPGVADGNGFEWKWPPLGAYTIWAADVDTSGNVGTPVSATITVDSSLLITSGGISPPPEWLNSNVLVGARNILAGASSGAGWTYDYHSGTEFRVTRAATTETGYIYSAYQLIPANTQITLSFESKQIGVVGSADLFILPDTYGTEGLLQTTYPLSSGWVKNSFVFTTPATWVSPSRLRIDHNGGNGSSSSVCVRNVKLEYGNTATDWTPPVEDVAGAIYDAQAAADAANAVLASIASDSILSPGEKPPVVQQYAVITGEQSGIDAQATYYGITTEKAAYDNAISALTTYLNTLPSWNTIPGVDVAIVGTTFRSKFSDVYLARQALLDKINAQQGAGITLAIANAATAQSTADGKIDSFYQTSPPTTFSNGDIWFDTDDGNKQYVASGGVWVLAADTRIGLAITNAAGAQATADGKVTTFYASSAPTATAVGDLWFNTTAGSTRLSRWNGTAWVVPPVIGNGDIGTPELGANAATEITQDTYSFGGSGTGSGVITQRSVTVTPAVNSVVNFSATIAADTVLPDSANYLYWAVSVGGGADTLIASCNSNSGNRQTFPATTSLSATGGVSLEFKLISNRFSGNPTMHLFDSSMHIEVIKR